MDLTKCENWIHVDPSTILWSHAMLTLSISLGIIFPEASITGALLTRPKAMAQVCGLIIFGNNLVPNLLW